MAILPVGNICGASVRGSDGEALGAITEVMIDSETGVVAYAVLSFGGVLGVGEKLFALDWQRLSPDPETGEVKAEITRERLEALPGFDKDAWPAGPDPALA